MNEPRQIPQIFDRQLLRTRQARALASGPEDFLLQRACDDLLDRLAATKRAFPRVADIETPTPVAIAALAAQSQTRIFTRLACLPEMPAANWTFTFGDAESLPFTPESFDLVTSLLALQWVNDLPGALVQIRRALAPDGLFLGCMIGGQTLHELRTAFAQAESELTGGASPRVAPFADIRDLGALLQRAGFALPVTDVDTFTVRYANMFALLRDLRAMGATSILHARSRMFAPRKLFLRAAEIYANAFASGDGRISATFEIIWMSGWAPHESQQKPLQPGSARMRLADALRVKDYDSGN